MLEEGLRAELVDELLGELIGELIGELTQCGKPCKGGGTSRGTGPTPLSEIPSNLSSRSMRPER